MESPVKQRVKNFIHYLKVSTREFERNSNLSNGYVNGIDKTIMPNKLNQISAAYPELNTAWLLTGIGEMLINNKNSTPENEAHAKAFPAHVEVKIVTTKARAGYLGAYYADEYLDDMPTILIESDKEHKGKYLAFEVDGDSMEPIYYKGDVVIGREIHRHLWSSKLHYKDWDFVIAHSTKGILIKEIVNHNVETGDITCHSINSDEYSDFVVNLKDVSYLYNIVEFRRSGKNSKIRR